MNEIELSPWYPPAQRPIRIGIYKVIDKYRRCCYRTYDGENWRYGGGSIKSAIIPGDIVDKDDILKWCGLAKDPSI